MCVFVCQWFEVLIACVLLPLPHGILLLYFCSHSKFELIRVWGGPYVFVSVYKNNKKVLNITQRERERERGCIVGCVCLCVWDKVVGCCEILIKTIKN